MSLQGTLRTLGIAEVLEFLAGRSATGRLEITADTGHATYWVSSGEIASVDYSFAREAGTDAAEATYYALAEVEGTFHFDEDQRPEDVEGTEAISDVLARTADTADGWSYVEEVIATPQHWLSRSETLDDTVAVQPEWWVAIAAVAEGTTSQKLAQALDMRALAASTMASEMVRAGLLQVGEPRSQQAAAMPAAEERAEPHEAHEAHEDHLAAPADHEGLNLFGVNTPVAEATSIEAEADASAELDELVTELEAHSSVEMEAPLVHSDFAADESEYPAEYPTMEESVPAPLSVVEPMDEPVDGAEIAEIAEADSFPADDAAPVSPALVWDAEATPETPSVPEMGPEHESSVYDAPAPAPAEDTSDWDDEDGWATDHSQPAAVAMATAEEFQSAPAAADVFGAAPAVDPATMPPSSGQHPGGEGSGDTPDEYATDDRSSVLKFLRRD